MYVISVRHMPLSDEMGVSGIILTMYNIQTRCMEQAAQAYTPCCISLHLRLR